MIELKKLQALAEAKVDRLDVIVKALKANNFSQIEKESDRVHFTRETKKTSDTFTVIPRGDKLDLLVQGYKHDIEVDAGCTDMADIIDSVKHVDAGWFKENDSDWK